MSTNAHDVDPHASAADQNGAGTASAAGAAGEAAAPRRLQQGDLTRFLSRQYRIPFAPLSKLLSFDDVTSWPADPMEVFSQWYADGEYEYNVRSPSRMDGPVHWPNTMQIATLAPPPAVAAAGSAAVSSGVSSGFPSVRTVLLKGFDPRGLIFFTNYDGAKGRALQADPRCALAFYWKTLERQVRIEGVAEKLTAEESDAYFHERPIQSQLGGVVSPQSRPLASHAELERAYVATVRGVAQQVQQHLEQTKLQQQGGGTSSEEVMAKTKERVAKLLSALTRESEKAAAATASSASSSNTGSAAVADALTPASPASSLPSPTSAESLAQAHAAHALALASLQKLDASPLTRSILHDLVKRPAYWGGFLIRPRKVEFWCDGAYRLHSRIVYSAATNIAKNSNAEAASASDKADATTADVQWTKTFLAP